MRLSALLEESRVVPLARFGPDPEIAGASLDSRNIESGDLFVAVRGNRCDGEAYVPEALRRGAGGIVAGSPRPAELDDSVAWVQVEDPRRAAGPIARECYGRPDEALSLVGVTGTNGKTTVVHLIEAIGAAAGRSCGRLGTIGYAFAGRQLALQRTTPEAPEVCRLLAEMRDAGVDLVAMEVSSHALALHRVEGLRFRVAVFLNLSRDHLDFHGDVESYFASKAKLFEDLGPEQWAVLPADDERGDDLASRTSGRVLTYGRSAAADVRLVNEHSGLEGSSAVIETPSGRLPVRTFLLGRYNLDNVAAAAACALALGLRPESIPSGVLSVEGVPGRMQPVDAGQPFSVIVDFAHTDAALENLLSWVRRVAPGRVIAVFGCGGSRDRSKRAAMGRVAARLADGVFLTSDNPRDEDPEVILAEIERGVLEIDGGRSKCRRIADRREAIVAAVTEARPGDVVVIAGKGHETRQVAGGGTREFDDRIVAAEALGGLGFKGGRHAGV